MATLTLTAVTVKDAAQIAASATTYYDVPDVANTFAIVKELTVANDTTTAITFTVYKLPDGGTAGDDNIIVKDQTLQGGDSFSITELLGDIYLERDGEIQAVASSASQATIHITAYEFTLA